MQEEKTKINTRGNNIRQKRSNYNGCFIERDNAVTFCKELETLHIKIMLEQDSKTLEDMEFDRLLGISTSSSSNGLSDEEIAQQLNIPHISIEESKQLESSQMSKLDSKVLMDFLYTNEESKRVQLKLKVEEDR